MIDASLVAEAGEIEALLKAGRRLRELDPSERRRAEYQAALHKFNAALNATVQYKRLVDADPSSYKREEEWRLAGLWTQASEAINGFDPKLANRAFIKGQGWLDPTVWDDPRYREHPTSIDSMRTALIDFQQEQFGRMQASEEPPPQWFPVAGVVFTFLAVVAIFYLIVRPESISQDRRILVDVMVALFVAAGASFLGGSARALRETVAHGRIPWVGDSPVHFAAAGGIATFIVTLLIMSKLNG